MLLFVDFWHLLLISSNICQFINRATQKNLKNKEVHASNVNHHFIKVYRFIYKFSSKSTFHSRSSHSIFVPLKSASISFTLSNLILVISIDWQSLAAYISKEDDGDPLTVTLASAHLVCINLVINAVVPSSRVTVMLLLPALFWLASLSACERLSTVITM